MAKKRKYLTLGNILSESFSLYFSNLLRLLVPFLIIVIPLIILIVGFILPLYNSTGDFSNLSSNFPISIFLFPTGLLVTSIICVGIKFIITRFLSNGYIGKKEKISEILLMSLRRLFPFFGLLILMRIIINIGSFFTSNDSVFLLIIGLIIYVAGIVLLLGWFVASEVFVIENNKVIDSMKRSWDLTNGYKGILFLYCLLLLASIIMFFILVGVIISGTLGTSFDAFFSSNSNSITIIMVLFFACFALFYPLLLSFNTVVYFNLKKEKESFDTEQLADSFLDETKESTID